jgi:hypothetical protein
MTMAVWPLPGECRCCKNRGGDAKDLTWDSAGRLFVLCAFCLRHCTCSADLIISDTAVTS